MKKQLGVFSDWYNPYLDVLDNLYGLQEYPMPSMDEVAEEWHRLFSARTTVLPAASPFLGGSDAYVSTLEDLHGELNLHPVMSVIERCEEWQRCFGANPVSLRVRTKPTGAGEEIRTWELNSAS